VSELFIRQSVPADSAAIEALYPQAFPDEDLVPLVRSLLTDPVVAMSLVALIDSEIIGHGMFTVCGIEGTERKVVLLGPLAVTPNRQRQGVGSEIVDAGLECARVTGADLVCVLGDPGYYGRSGFTPDTRIEPPYALPPEWGGAWQSQSLTESGEPLAGQLVVPPQWQEPALWGA
jgi:putative acetyltransferase